MNPKILLLLVFLTVFGCSKEKTWPVTGKVVFTDGSPVTSGVIEFSPKEEGKTARGKIGSDGRFNLETAESEGALPGDYRISVVQMIVAERHPDHLHHLQRVRRVAPKFFKASTSGLDRTVKAGDNHFVIKVEPVKTKRRGF